MSGFMAGFVKEAAVGEMLKRIGAGALNAGRSLAKGVGQAGSTTVGDALKLKGLGGIGTGGKGLGTIAGRKNLAESVGKAAPSIAAAGAYGYGAKKVYDKTLGTSQDSGYGY